MDVFLLWWELNICAKNTIYRLFGHQLTEKSNETERGWS